jgi:hypothetical protein
MLHNLDMTLRYTVLWPIIFIVGLISRACVLVLRFCAWGLNMPEVMQED